MTDPIAVAARFLADPGQLEWMRHRPECGEFLEDVESCWRDVVAIARGPAELMTGSLCVRCDKPTPDGAACTACMSRARRLLVGDPRDDTRPGITDAAPAARAVAYGLTRTGPGAGGSAGPGIPLDPDAVERLHAVQNALTTWARLISEERGAPLP